MLNLRGDRITGASQSGQPQRELRTADRRKPRIIPDVLAAVMPDGRNRPATLSGLGFVLPNPCADVGLPLSRGFGFVLPNCCAGVRLGLSLAALASFCQTAASVSGWPLSPGLASFCQTAASVSSRPLSPGLASFRETAGLYWTRRSLAVCQIAEMAAVSAGAPWRRFAT